MSTRLVNKVWTQVAASHLFEEFLLTPLSLERLRIISQHEHIATCVKSINFYAHLLPFILPEMWDSPYSLGICTINLVDIVRSNLSVSSSEQAQNLQKLKLHAFPSEYRNNDLLRCLCPSLTKLSMLKLYGITTTEESLIDTLLIYQATLTRLNMMSVYLADRNTGRPMISWTFLFNRISDCLRYLLEIRLNNLKYGGRSGRQYHHYIRRTDIPPLTEDVTGIF